MSDWSAAVSGSEVVDKEQLKRELDLRAVCERELGVLFTDLYNADCPFHPDDGKAHFSVYGEDLTQVGCWVCSWRGDVFDVIMTARSCGFKEAVGAARTYLSEGVTLDPTEVDQRSRIYVTPETWTVVINAARGNATADDHPIADFLLRKNLRIGASWLREEFRVGVRGGIGTILIPHYDRNDVPLGYKERRWDTVPLSARGSRFNDLYGAWRDSDAQHAVICEGESDTWTVAHLGRDLNVDVFGLPTGAGTPPREHLTSLLEGRRVTLAFDADDAGRLGAERWSAVLSDTSVLRLPDGLDCSSADPQLIREAMGETTKT